jgi:hypothetical protein
LCAGDKVGAVLVKTVFFKPNFSNTFPSLQTSKLKERINLIIDDFIPLIDEFQYLIDDKTMAS